jgi:hypothetical protein
LDDRPQRVQKNQHQALENSKKKHVLLMKPTSWTSSSAASPFLKAFDG